MCMRVCIARSVTQLQSMTVCSEWSIQIHTDNDLLRDKNLSLSVEASYSMRQLILTPARVHIFVSFALFTFPTTLWVLNEQKITTSQS